LKETGDLLGQEAYMTSQLRLPWLET